MTCSDGKHCCPADMPVCDAQAGACSSADGKQSTPWSAKFKASLAAKHQPGAEQPGAEQPAELPAEQQQQEDEQQQEEQQQEEQQQEEQAEEPLPAAS